MMMKNKFVICSVVIIVLTACIICTGCTSTQSAQTTLPTIPPSITTTSQPPDPTATMATTTASMEQTTAPTAIPEPILTPEVPSAQPAFTSAPGDPSSVLVSYPDLFNTGNGEGLYALLSENMKLHYPIDTLNNELAAARSNGYIIEKVQVNNQIIEENTTILEVDISWKIAGSPVTSTPRFFLVYENDQWKLDSLIVSPQSS
jgi:hypothetical protein